MRLTGLALATPWRPDRVALDAAPTGAGLRRDDLDLLIVRSPAGQQERTRRALASTSVDKPVLEPAHTYTLCGPARAGEGSDVVGGSQLPPFATAAAADDRWHPHNEFHLVLRSHGPIIPGEVVEQLTTFNGGCEVQVGPLPEQVGDFPVPSEPGECGDVQLHVFSSSAWNGRWPGRSRGGPVTWAYGMSRTGRPGRVGRDLPLRTRHRATYTCM